MSSRRKSRSIRPKPAPPVQHPFYHYVDYSRETDPDPYIPLTAAGRVPTFPAKLHAILLRSSTDFEGVVAWLPHGRSWRIINVTEFETRVIPMYFEFTKHHFSNFLRQAKLWGFRRMKREGPDLDSYYNPRFLRGLPHLCKNLKRISVRQPEYDPDQEPDLAAISDMHAVPVNYDSIADSSIGLSWFLNVRAPGDAVAVASLSLPTLKGAIESACTQSNPDATVSRQKKRSRKDLTAHW